jgi:hypothetical protein
MSPEERAAVRGQLARELFLRMLIHDIRNPLTPIMGALELLEMGGTRLPGFLTQSVENLGVRLAAYDEQAWCTAPPPRSLAAEVAAALGIEVVGDAPAPLDPRRLVAALELAAPARVEFAPGAKGWRAEVRLHGLRPEAVTAATSPSFEALSERFARPDAVLGAALLRVVARDAGGQVHSKHGETPPVLSLLLP